MTLEPFGISVSSETWKLRIHLVPELPWNLLEIRFLRFIGNSEMISFLNDLGTLQKFSSLTSWILQKLRILNTETKSISILNNPTLDLFILSYLLVLFYSWLFIPDPNPQLST